MRGFFVARGIAVNFVSARKNVIKISCDTRVEIFDIIFFIFFICKTCLGLFFLLKNDEKIKYDDIDFKRVKCSA